MTRSTSSEEMHRRRDDLVRRRIDADVLAQP